MISDAYILVTCDSCGYKEEITPEVYYRDYSGKTPFIDLSDGALDDEVRKHARRNGSGWTIKRDGGESKHYCEDCSCEDEND